MEKEKSVVDLYNERIGQMKGYEPEPEEEIPHADGEILQEGVDSIKDTQELTEVLVHALEEDFKDILSGTLDLSEEDKRKAIQDAVQQLTETALHEANPDNIIQYKTGKKAQMKMSADKVAFIGKKTIEAFEVDQTSAVTDEQYYSWVDIFEERYNKPSLFPEKPE